MSMSSTSFPSIVSPQGSGSYRALPAPSHSELAGQPYANGGAIRKKPKAHVTVIIPVMQPHPLLGALTRALLLHHIVQQQGALRRGGSR